MRTARDVTGRLARWAIKLSAYQIEDIRYRPGKANANADSLSRNPIAAEESNEPELANVETAINIWEQTSILHEIKEQQRTDTKLQPIIKTLESSSTVQLNDKRSPYVLVNSLLYKIKNLKKYYDERNVGNKHLLIIPKSMQTKVLRWAHDHPTAGHGGQQRTLFRLSNQVHWDTMRKDVYKYIAACSDCQQFKYNNSPTAGPMQLHMVNEPWHTIGIDLMGPFPTTIRQKRFLLVIVDYFTRWVELFPLKSTTSTDIANVLSNEIFARYGLPRYIVSDNGPQFVSNIFEDFCKTLHIGQNLTANYHPQSNMTERVNRTLKPLIAIYAQQQPHAWDKEIQKLAFAIRTAINETTGETPAFMMFGRNPRSPLDVITGQEIEGPPATGQPTAVQEYKENLVDNLQRAYHLIREHAQIEKLKQKEKYDHHTVQRNYAVGDLVWVTIPAGQIGDNSLGGKMQPRYQGPCQLKEKLTPVTFTVRRLKDNVDLGATNVDRLKPYFEQDPQETSQPRAETDRDPLPQERLDRPDPQQNKQRSPTATTLDRRVSNRRRKVPIRFIEQ